jgi:hypothetical protein
MDRIPSLPNSCSACDLAYDPGDNYCRRCGAAFRGAELPTVRGTSVMTVWQPQLPRVVKGAAVVAAGTVGQFLFRRIVRGLLAGDGRPTRAGAIRVKRPRHDDGMVDEAQIITETVMLRRVRVRRQA